MKKRSKMAKAKTREIDRFSSGVLPLDYVLGGGIARGSTVLVLGAPGVGKTRLLASLLLARPCGEKVALIDADGVLSLMQARALIDGKASGVSVVVATIPPQARLARSRLVHDFDVVVNLLPGGRLVCTKNRYGREGEEAVFDVAGCLL